MPRVNLGRTDPGMIFGKKMKSVIMESDGNCTTTADKIGISNITLSRRFKDPSQMTLGQLRIFIRITGLRKEDVIAYLYGKGQADEVQKSNADSII